MKDIKNLNLEELEIVMKRWGEPVFHAKQIFAWLYQKGVQDFGSMSNLPVSLRKRLAEEFYSFGLKVAKKQASMDATEKLLFELVDGNLIEAVSIPSKERVTGCLSTQAGCKFNCAFCASGKCGFKRNLTVGEILEEALYLKDKSKAGKLTHIVFMGTGEPLDNYANLMKSIRVINSPQGFNIGARRITVSTCGIIPGIKKMAEEGLQIELSVSLHAADDKLRSELMPVNKKYPLKDLMAACREYFFKTNRQVTFEYVLIKGLNSDLLNARNLITIMQGFDCKVNLIPANPVKEMNITAPGKEEISAFKNYLIKAGVQVTLRTPRGEDIDAACGQLRLQDQRSHSKNQR